MTIRIIKRGKARRLRSPKDLLHKPMWWGQGKWENLASLWAYKRASRKARKVAAKSRRTNLLKGRLGR